MRTLVIDIETSPHVADVWGLWNQNVGINQLHESSQMICFAAEWAHNNKTLFHSMYAESYHDMVLAVWDLLDEADAVVGWNSDKFDNKRINNEFVIRGITPPSPYKSIDLLKTVKRQFSFPSNKLDYVAGALGHGNKLSTGGHDLWRKCLEFDPRAWKLMEKYNKQDVKLTKALYLDLIPWISGHPNMSLYNGTGDVIESCVNCGSSEVQKRGFYYAETSMYQKYCCTLCGKWFRSTKRVGSTTLRSVS